MVKVVNMDFSVWISERLHDASLSEALASTLGMTIVLLVCYLGVGLAFLRVDLHNKPRWMVKYKTQPGKNEPVDRKELKRLQDQVVFNYKYIAFPYTLLHYILQKLRGVDLSWRIPGVAEFLLQLVVFTIWTEITFYYAHRALHSPYLYKRVHKLHHEWTAPIGLGAVYAHPVEFLVGNLMVVMSGPLIMGSCQVVTLAWIGVALIHTTITHSGYHLPLLPSPEYHDYHHLKFVGNYGVTGLLDWFHNTTNPYWLKSKQYRRHKLIFSDTQMK